MPLETLALFALVSLVPVISPGPAVLLAVGNALRFGARATAYSALGNGLGLLALGFAVSYGLGALMAASASAFLIVKLVGAAYLVFLGLRILFGRAAFAPATAAPAPPPRARALFLEAVVVAVTNPKPILVMAALFPQFLSPEHVLLPQVAILSATYAGLCVLNHLLLAAFAGRIRSVLMTERGARWVRRTLGTAFIGFGGALAASSR